ncbi:MAG: EamA family transporter, partial [Rhodothermales bacterium]
LGQIYLTKGLHAEQAGRAMSMSYLQILFAAIWGALFFGEIPDVFAILGALFVMGGTVLVARG